MKVDDFIGKVRRKIGYSRSHNKKDSMIKFKKSPDLKKTQLSRLPTM